MDNDKVVSSLFLIPSFTANSQQHVTVASCISPFPSDVPFSFSVDSP